MQKYFKKEFTKLKTKADKLETWISEHLDHKREPGAFLELSNILKRMGVIYNIVIEPTRLTRFYDLFNEYLSVAIDGSVCCYPSGVSYSAEEAEKVFQSGLSKDEKLRIHEVKKQFLGSEIVGYTESKPVKKDVDQLIMIC